MSKTNMRRIRLLYGAFMGIMMVCLVLFFMNMFASDEPSILRQVGSQLNERQRYAIGITDLPCEESDVSHTYAVGGVDGDKEISARVTRFDIAVSAADPELLDSPYMWWVCALQIFSAVALLVIFLLVIILLVRFYRSFRSGRPFENRVVGLLIAIGILLLLMTLSVDTSTYLEREVADMLLAGSEWHPQHHFTIHFTRIFFSIVILFTAELLRIGRDMQREQDLTI